MDNSNSPLNKTPADVCADYMAAEPLTNILFQEVIGVESVHTLYNW